MTTTDDALDNDLLAGVAEQTGVPLLGPAVQYAIEQFYYFELRLLDERRYSEWWDLFTEDARYWMPIRTNRLSRERHLENSRHGDMAFIDDDKMGLGWKVKHAEHPMAWSEDPPSRTRHLLTNVWVRRADVVGEFDVDSNFLVYRNRVDTEVDVWAGKREDRLRVVDGRVRIVKRTVLLDQSVILSKNLSVFF